MRSSVLVTLMFLSGSSVLAKFGVLSGGAPVLDSVPVGFRGEVAYVPVVEGVGAGQVGGAGNFRQVIPIGRINGFDGGFQSGVGSRTGAFLGGLGQLVGDFLSGVALARRNAIARNSELGVGNVAGVAGFAGPGLRSKKFFNGASDFDGGVLGGVGQLVANILGGVSSIRAAGAGRDGFARQSAFGALSQRRRANLGGVLVPVSGAEYGAYIAPGGSLSASYAPYLQVGYPAPSPVEAAPLLGAAAPETKPKRGSAFSSVSVKKELYQPAEVAPVAAWDLQTAPMDAEIKVDAAAFPYTGAKLKDPALKKKLIAKNPAA